MSYGVEVRNGSAAIRLTPGDAIHRVVLHGSVTFDGTTSTRYVPVAGMTENTDWFVVVSEDAFGLPTSGQLVITFFGLAYIASPVTVYYTIYRR